MPRKPTGKQTGKPIIHIDWKIVDLRLEAGNCGTEIADFLGIHSDTLYERCQNEKGSTFSAYAQRKKKQGDLNLAYKQYIKAIGPDIHCPAHGSEKMLIHLGMDRLGQMKKESVQHSGEVKHTVVVSNYTLSEEEREELKKKYDKH